MGTSSFKIFFPPQPFINLEEKLIWRNLPIFNKLFAFKKWLNNSPAFTINFTGRNIRLIFDRQLSIAWKLSTKVQVFTMMSDDTKAVTRRCSVKKVFWKISQSSQESTCAEFSFKIKLLFQDLHLYLKRDSGTGVFL